MGKLEELRRLREARVEPSGVGRNVGSVSNGRVTNRGRVSNGVSNRDPRDGLTKLQRWRAAHRRQYNEYMQAYMRDWRCRNAVRKVIGK